MRKFSYGAKSDYSIKDNAFYNVIDVNGNLKGRMASCEMSDFVIEKLLEFEPEKKVDLIYTDPPYSLSIANTFRSSMGLPKYSKLEWEIFMRGIAEISYKYSRRYLIIEWSYADKDLMNVILQDAGWKLLKEVELLYPPPSGTNVVWMGVYSKFDEPYNITEDPHHYYQSQWVFRGKQASTPSVCLWVHRNFVFDSMLDLFHGIGRFTRQAFLDGSRIYGCEFNSSKLSLFREFLEKNEVGAFLEV